MRKHIITSVLPAAAISAALVLGLSACGQNDTSEPEAASTSQAASASLTLGDAWVKTAEEGMTGVFGTLENTTDKDINLVAAKYDGAGMVQLHETVDDGTGTMTMREKKGGFVIPAGGSFVLEPGGNHIMVMHLKQPIKAGEKIDVQLVTADDETIPVKAIAKDYSGAQETYAPGEAEAGKDGEKSEKDGMGDMSGMDMSGDK